MTLLFFSVFIFTYSLVVARFGSMLDWQQISPQYFLPLALYLTTQIDQRVSFWLVLLTGLFSDIDSQHTWALHSCYFVTLYLLLYRSINILDWSSLFFNIPLAFVCTLLLGVLEQFASTNPNAMQDLFFRAIVTALATPFFFHAFKLSRLPWGLRRTPIDFGARYG